MYAEEVAADFVFRLGQSTTSPGRWLRTFTVTKSAGVNMSVGEHTWALLTREGLVDVIAQPTVRDWIRLNAARERHFGSSDTVISRSWASVGIFPKGAAEADRLRQSSRERAEGSR